MIDAAYQDGLHVKCISFEVQTWTELKTVQRQLFPANTNVVVWDCYIFPPVMGLSYRYNLIRAITCKLLFFFLNFISV